MIKDFFDFVFVVILVIVGGVVGVSKFVIRFFVLFGFGYVVVIGIGKRCGWFLGFCKFMLVGGLVE